MNHYKDLLLVFLIALYLLVFDDSFLNIIEVMHVTMTGNWNYAILYNIFEQQILMKCLRNIYEIFTIIIEFSTKYCKGE